MILKNEGGPVRLKPDLRSGRDWFYWHFEATADEPGEVEFVFEGALRIGVCGPAISEDGGKNWQWMGAEAVTYVNKASKEPPTESFRFAFSEKNKKVRFAVAIPYLQRDLDAFLARVDGNPHLTRTELTRTRRGKPVELLQVGEPGPGRESIIVTARHHACESMASYVLEAFLEEALSESPAARSFRDRYVIFAVPMMDKDGVQAGDQGKWRFPHDHNRDYGQNSLYPEVQALQKLAKKVEVKLALDFHCPSLRGETHEVFYFIGIGLPHLHDNTEELKGWITEERPHTIPTGPFNFMRDPPAAAPEKLIDEKFSVWFAYLEGVRYAATFEIPYSQANFSYDADMARAYGRSVLRAWEKCEFVADPAKRSPNGSAGLIAFRKKFGAEYKSRPDDAEKLANALAANPNTSPSFRVEAENSLGLLRLRQKRFAEALSHFKKTANLPFATSQQRLTAATQSVLATCQNPKTSAVDVEAALREFKAFPYPSDSAQFEVFGAASIFFEKADNINAAFELVQLQLPTASKIQRGATLNRIATFHDQLDQPGEALNARKAAVTHLREQLDPVPVGIFGPSMGRDLFDALLKIPGATTAEKQAAAEIVLNHNVAPGKMKEEVRAKLANMEP